MSTTTVFSPATLEKLRLNYKESLQQFNSGPNTFQVLNTITCQDSAVSRPAVLYVLDSSFNPPTFAHLRIAASAFRAAHKKGSISSARLLLLLATQNADKPSKPALFEDRLIMMQLLARDLHESLSKGSDYLKLTKDDFDNHDIPPIDIGVTKEPYFVDKAAAIAGGVSGNGAENTYPKGVEQIHLTGYDTLTRIFDPKYYPPDHTLQPLDPLFTSHRLRVTLRPDDGWGGRDEQQSFLTHLAEGKLGDIGGKREWAERIELADSNEEDEGPISSTMARNSVKTDHNMLGKLVPLSVQKYIKARDLYTQQ